MKEKARLVLGALVTANVLVYARQDVLSPLVWSHSIYDSSLISIIASMFHHADVPHLVVNMLCLWYYGNEVFVNSSSKTWQYPLVILVIYLFSGIGGACGTIALSHLFESQWNQRLQTTRDAITCSSWMCQSLSVNYAILPFADLGAREQDSLCIHLLLTIENSDT